MTKVINILGGSGIGKSTISAGLYYKMKLAGYSVELVREYVKNWMWENREIGQYDQLYIFGQQAKAEYNLYKKVDYIITDSPLILSSVYEQYYSPPSIILDAAKKLIKKAEGNGVKYLNFVLKRKNSHFNPEGRRENLQQAIDVDNLTKEMLNSCGMQYVEIESQDEARVDEILKHLKCDK